MLGPSFRMVTSQKTEQPDSLFPSILLYGIYMFSFDNYTFFLFLSSLRTIGVYCNHKNVVVGKRKTK